MKRDDERDERIHELFSAARRADRTTAPGYRDVIERERVVVHGPTRRTVRLGPTLALASSLGMAALASVWLLEPALQVAPVQIAERQPAVAAPAPQSEPTVSTAESRKVEPEPVVEQTTDGDVIVAEALVEPSPSPPVRERKAIVVRKYAPPPPPPAATDAPLAELARTAQVEQFSDENISDLPVPGRYYQEVLTMARGVQDADGDGNPNVHGSRSRDFKAKVGGVSNGDPLAGQWASRINTNSIEEMETVTAGAGVKFGEAQRHFAAIVGADDAEQPDLERHRADFNTEGYDRIVENEFLAVTDNPLSTFSIDVDTASYANVRRFLTAGRKPPRDAVRIEELINYFRYDYPDPAGGEPFSVHAEVAGCPWNDEHQLVRVGLKGREVSRHETAGSNLVFLIDVSGSMADPNKLPLLKRSLQMLVRQLDRRDQVAIVVYAGASGLVLPSTPGDRRREIQDALLHLQSGGSTNGGAGLRLAYRIARENFIPGGVNRVILCTDGDFNIGVTTQAELLGLIEEDARSGIFLTVLGFGMGNYRDGMLEMLTGKGNGNYAYIDGQAEARKVLVEQLSGTLVAIAKDVKIQVEFNPAEVGGYRLIGYENRVMAKEDFNDDRKDAGEIGAGHTVTALYEIVPVDRWQQGRAVDPLRYQASAGPTSAARSGELLTVKLRYKQPEEDTSRLTSFPVSSASIPLSTASGDFKFAAAVAEFGLLLRESVHRADASFEQVRMLALQGRGADPNGYRAEFLNLVDRASAIASD